MLSLSLAAFMAGIISFFSPCVLPLVPGYLSLISGTGMQELEQGGKGMRSVLLSAMLFILGFSVVFIALGAVASSIGQLVREHIGILSRMAGAVIIALGLHQTGLLPIRFLYADKRLHHLPGGAGSTRAFLAGSAFAFGWTPCVGPILAVILTFATAEATLLRGMSLLAVYALGLAVPFLLTALSIRLFFVFYEKCKRYLHTVEVIGGVVMIAAGVLIFTRHFVLLSNFVNRISLFRHITERFL